MIQLPEPVFACSVMANSSADETLLKETLENIQAEDPSVKVTNNVETGQTTINTMGELHLEIVQDRILNHYKVKANFGTIFIAYRYTKTWILFLRLTPVPLFLGKLSIPTKDPLLQRAETAKKLSLQFVSLLVTISLSANLWYDYFRRESRT